jgi:hypothetical protein
MTTAHAETMLEELQIHRAAWERRTPLRTVNTEKLST